MNIIEVKNLTKKFGKFTAVDAVSFEVKKGEIFGFLGPNGAGKSTTINMLATLLPPTSGDAFINNFSCTKDTDEVRRSIGLVFQDPSLDDKLTAEENLRFHARLYGVPHAEYEKRMEEVLKLVDLFDRRREVVKHFSGGTKRRLEIARGLIHYPTVLFLDEPTLGLDPQTRASLWDYILKLKREKQMTIFMTTHYMSEAEYCDRIGIIDKGKIMALDSPKNLKRALGGDIVMVHSSKIFELEKELKKLKLNYKKEDESFQIKTREGETFLPKLLKELKTSVDRVEMREPTLEDVFLHLTGRAIREEEASEKEMMRASARRRMHH
jgi:ABC-2 type transport system ATP-binding protein